jgi:prepilin-type N-terminal cleavage/methylation domain-containing protein
MIKKRGAFTLIELMVVVAIIAILSSMGVANFSTAIKKARNAVRQTDIKAVSTALETCFNIMTGSYGFRGAFGTSPAGVYSGELNTVIKQGETAKANTPFKADLSGAGDGNRCLQADVIPKLQSYDYVVNGTFDTTTGREYYIACAKLENVGGVETMGNVTGATGITGSTLVNYQYTANACASDLDDCWFCISNQQ